MNKPQPLLIERVLSRGRTITLGRLGYNEIQIKKLMHKITLAFIQAHDILHNLVRTRVNAQVAPITAFYEVGITTRISIS